MHDGPVPLLPAVPGMAERERLRIAMLIPPFGRGSGGHNILLQILSRLERRGHICSVWVHDFDALVQRSGRRRVLRHEIVDWFAPIEGPVFTDFEPVAGADVVIATGWQTVHPALGARPDCRARVYVVNDHEPEFYMASSERALAEDTYRHGLHCIAASPWLRDLLAERYGATSRGLPVRGRPRRLPAAARRAAPRTRSSTTRATRRRGARSRHGLMALRGAAQAPARTQDRPVRHPGPHLHAVPVRAPRDPLARSSCRGCTRRRRSGCACR